MADSRQNDPREPKVDVQDRPVEFVVGEPQPTPLSAPTFSVNHFVTENEVKRLGVFTHEEMGLVVQTYENLMKLLPYNNGYKLRDNQKIILRLKDNPNDVQLTTFSPANINEYENLDHSKLRNLFTVADFVQILRDIRAVFANDESDYPSVAKDRDFELLERVGDAEDGKFSLISIVGALNNAEKNIKELIDGNDQAVDQYKNYQKKEQEEAGSADISGGKSPDSEKLAKLETEARAAGFRRTAADTDAGEGEASEHVDAKDIRKEFRDELQTHIRDIQSIQILIEEQLIKNIFDGTSLSRDAKKLMPEIRESLAENFMIFLEQYEDREKFFGGDGVAKDWNTVIRAFLASTAARQSFLPRVDALLNEVVTEAVQRGNLAEAQVVIEKLESLSKELPAVSKDVIKEMAQKISIASLPKATPAATASQKAEELKIERLSEIKDKATQLLIAKLSLHLDPAEAFHLREQIEAEARKLVDGLDENKLNFLTQDPRYAEQLAAGITSIGGVALQNANLSQDQLLSIQLEKIFGANSISLVQLGNIKGTLETMGLTIGGDVSVAEQRNKLTGFISFLSDGNLELMFGISLAGLSAEKKNELKALLGEHLVSYQASLALGDETGIVHAGLAGQDATPERIVNAASKTTQLGSAPSIVRAFQTNVSQESGQELTEAARQVDSAMTKLKTRIEASLLLQSNLSEAQIRQIQAVITNQESQISSLALSHLISQTEAGIEVPQHLTNTDLINYETNAQTMIRQGVGPIAEAWGRGQERSGIASKAGSAVDNLRKMAEFAKDAAKGPIGAIMGAAKTKTGRAVLAGAGLGAAYALKQTLFALSTPAGAIGGALGGFAGTALIPLFGPLSPILGTAIGANFAAGITGGGGGNFLGLSNPIPPWESSSSGLSSSGASSGSFAQMRAAERAGATSSGAETGSAGNASTAPSSAAQATTYSQPIQASYSAPAASSGAATAAASSSGPLAGLIAGGTVAIAAVAGPVIAIGAAVLLTLHILFTIYGAFLVSVPSDGIGPKTIYEQSKYASLEKTASKNQFDNNTASIDPTYTLKISPRQSYKIKITNVTDSLIIFSGSAEDIKISAPKELSDESKTKIAELISEPSSEPSSASYSEAVNGSSLVDSLIINSATITFDVFDEYDNPISSSQILQASSPVKIGNPRIGCWPTSGKVLQLPYGDFSHNNGSGLDAYDIGGPVGTPIYAPFSGTLTGAVDPKPSGGYGNYGRLETSFGTFMLGHMVSVPESGEVKAGDFIGFMGNTGFSTTPHLHYELRHGSDFTLDQLIAKTGAIKVGDYVSSCGKAE